MGLISDARERRTVAVSGPERSLAVAHRLCEACVGLLDVQGGHLKLDQVRCRAW
jgi:hypothetical protein